MAEGRVAKRATNDIESGRRGKSRWKECWISAESQQETSLSLLCFYKTEEDVLSKL